MSKHLICEMVRLEVLVELLYLGLLSVSASGPPLSCVSPQYTGIRFSLFSLRNSTGHWNAQVELEHRGGHMEAGPSEVNIDNTPTKLPPGPTQRLLTRHSVPDPSHYKLHTVGQTWDEARRICLSEGSHLLVLNSAEEFAIVKAIWDRNPNFTDAEYMDYIHVGLREISQNNYVTDSGVFLNDTGYQIWDINEPNNNVGNEECVTLRYNGGLNDEYCTRKLAFICEKVQVEHGCGHKEAGPREVNIDHTSTKYPSHYKLHTVGQTWDEARRICLSEGSQLLVLNSAEEFAVVKAIWDRNPSFTDAEYMDYIHVGLREISENNFVTDSGVFLNDTGYQIWDINEPNNNVGNEECVTLRYNGGLNDEYCTRKLAFICEKEQLEHGCGYMEAGPWVNIDQTSTKCEEAETIMIVATVTVPPAPPQRSLISDSHKVPDPSHYKFHEVGETWYEARRICLSEGSLLLVLNSAEEFVIVRAIWLRIPYIIAADDKEFIHVGLRGITKNNYFTDSGVHLNDTGYPIWDLGEPNYPGDKPCMALKISGGLHDTNCDWKLAFICEKEI